MVISLLSSKLFVQLVGFCDVLFAWIIVGPLVAIFWATTWKLYDLYIFPENPVVSGAVTFAFGFCGQIVLMFYQDSIKNGLRFEKGNVFNIILPKIYALFVAHTFVSCWHGIWNFVDASSTNTLGVMMTNIVQSSIILMMMRAFRNALVPPYFVLSDQRDSNNAYGMMTLLNKSKADGNFTFFLDCVLSMIVEMMVASIWHDIWFIHDANLFPDDLTKSAVSSLVIGYVLALFCFSMQSTVSRLCEKSNEKKIFIYDAFMVVSLLSAVNCWRGVWTLTMFFVGNYTPWIFTMNTMAWVLLMSLNCTLSISAKDVLKDAHPSGKDCAIFQIQYFENLLQPKRQASQQTEKPNPIEISISTIS